MEEKVPLTNVEILEAVRHWQSVLGLGEWEISIDIINTDYISDSGEMARCLVDEDSMSAIIVLAVDFPVEEVKKSIRHELLHIALYQMRSSFEDGVQLLGAETQTVLTLRYSKSEESTVIRLERMLDRLLPEKDSEEENA